jgi:hypothetical protein
MEQHSGNCSPASGGGGSGPKEKTRSLLPAPGSSRCRRAPLCPSLGFGGYLGMDPTEKSSPAAISRAKIPEPNRFG